MVECVCIYRYIHKGMFIREIFINRFKERRYGSGVAEILSRGL
jgi:hypothetical protein